MIITSVEKDNKNRGMLSVFVDEEYAFSIPEEDYLRLCLYDKKELSSDEIEEIKNTITQKSAKYKAIKYLSYKYMTEAELSAKLRNDGYDEHVILDVVNELKSMGYINDMIFAQKYVYDRIKLKPKGKKMLKMELSKKGVSNEISDQVLGELDFDEDVVIERLIRKKFGKYDMKEPKIERKIYSFLLHRGFDFEDIKGVLRRITDSD
ncbi:regulatory protein RecX [Acetivibrio mesophilus]|uniref:Regulatory protein RecX n=1 Tax=Acetivibrio mesophilus TaxID=2487273 RepID=A0A4Q0I675_9FIRM|nr:regulatory protein RecX [Acetivibrio mesophilus]ODM25113.1 recombinase RecX [Clostridium sp. Bc-iso-3]RXE59883.1 regulatory protein RecX [Acetivibrio mesophilus]HHV29658.1 regulatory protein RecX [Clostridium sp.]